MIDLIGEYGASALVGVVGGILLGLAARLGRFCTLGAIEDRLYGGSDLRLRMWGIAIGVAIVGTFALIATGALPAADTLYLGLHWNPLGSVLGGLAFGYGMALAGNCGYGALARLGGGDLRSFVIVLVMGVAAYATVSGPLAPLRAALFPIDAVTDDRLPGIAHGLARLTGLGAPAIGIALGLALLAVSVSLAIRGAGSASASGARASSATSSISPSGSAPSSRVRMSPGGAASGAGGSSARSAGAASSFLTRAMAPA